MLTLKIPPHLTETIEFALIKAGRREIGGILMAEHTGINTFTVRELTVHRRGAYAYFIRRIEDAIGGLHSYFKKTKYNYTKFNYVGEWHSHPSFSLHPSEKDDTSMLQIVQDDTVGANFVVLLIVKLNSRNRLTAIAHTYLPDGQRLKSNVEIIS